MCPTPRPKGVWWGENEKRERKYRKKRKKKGEERRSNIYKSLVFEQARGSMGQEAS